MHSDKLTKRDVLDAATIARSGYGQDIYVDEIMSNGSRSRASAVTFYAASANGSRASNRHGKTSAKAASWTAYGYLIAELFRRDADAIVGPYNGADDFARQVTRYTPKGESLDFLALIGVKVIHEITRARSSLNGNPAFNISFADDPTSSVRTASDAGFAYAIGNSDMREGSPVRVSYSRSGRITNLSAV